MGYPREGSKAWNIAKEHADASNMTIEQACDKLGLITLEDTKTKVSHCAIYKKRCPNAYVDRDGFTCTPDPELCSKAKDASAVSQYIINEDKGACPMCRGTGKFDLLKEECRNCRGTGIIKTVHIMNKNAIAKINLNKE